MPRRGFTMVEAVLSLVLISGVAVALLSTMSTAAKAGQVAHRQRMGAELAIDMLSEVLATPYDTNVLVVGMETTSVDALVPSTPAPITAGSDRMTKVFTKSFDGFNESSAVTKSGTPIPNATGWNRLVTVRYADASNIDATPGSDTGLALVTVIVMYNGGEVARASALRARAWDELVSGEGLGQ